MVILLRAAVVLIILTVATGVLAAPKAERWARWERHDPHAVATIDHALWGDFLRRHVRTDPEGVNRVDYGAVDARDRGMLGAYIAAMSGTLVSRFDRPEQMAYWINLYNALTVNLIVTHYPVRSIKEIRLAGGGWFSGGPWGAKLVKVEDEEVSLDDIEHRILRPIWRDPRVHYALNCASLGCPNLRPTPFAGATLDRDLDMAAMDFMSHPRAVRIERGRLYVSSIYVWFEADFGGSDQSVIHHLMAYTPPGLAMELQQLDSIAGHDYDWELNDLATASPPK